MQRSSRNPAPRAPEQRLHALVHVIALTVGVTVAVAIPTGYFGVSYVDEARALQFKARLSAARLAKHVYVQADNWRYGKHRLSELLVYPESADERVRQYVMDAAGSLVFAQGHPGPAPTIRETAPIIVGGETAGRIEAETSLRPMLWRTAAAGAVGLLLAIAAYLAVHAFPLRALRRALGELEEAKAGLETQVAETQYAYSELARHHRAAEEAAQELARALQQAEEAQRAAAAANRAKSEFLANMSHELRTPLNAVIGFSDIMRQELFGALGHPQYRDYARDISECGTHLLEVVNDILDLAKIEAGKLELHLEMVDWVRVVEASCRLVTARAEEAGIRLEIDLPPKSEAVPYARADETKLKQILLNLVGNAVKFTSRGGAVTVTAQPCDGMIEFRIDDTGIGMNAEELAEALKPFRQVDNTHTRQHQGTGLGLPLAKALTELHGGTFEITSVPAQGTSVLLRLPIAERKSSSSAA